MSISLLGMAASIRPDSVNKKLLNLALGIANTHGTEAREIDYAQVIDAAPYRNEDTQAFPENVNALSAQLRAADGLILASPEYNWSMPGSLKNIIDWLSVDGTKPLKGLNALLLCASPSVRGGILGLQQLSLPLAHLGVYVYPHVIAIGDADKQLTAEGIAGKKDDRFLRECIADFVRLCKTNPRARA
jgi:chromate reductase, NAD(P)H dehydrogenase (quinone)